MAIGAYTMAILVVKEGWSMWLAAPLAGRRRGLAGLLLGLPSLRLRADYFAIVTIAFSEIVRYVATNENALTGGSQGTIALGEVGKAAQYNGQWERFQARVQGWLHVSSSDVAMLVIVWSVAVVLLAARLAGGAHAVGPSAARDPRGRGRGCRRSARTCSRTSSRCLRSARRSAASQGSSTPGSSRSSAPTTSGRCSRSSPG